MKMRRKILWLLGSVAGFALLVFLALWQGLPRVLPAVAADAVQVQLGRTLVMGPVSFDPLSLRLQLRDLVIKSADGQAEDLAVGLLDADLSASSLWQLAPILDSLTVDGLRLRIVQDAQGQFSFDDVLQRIQAMPASPEPARFALHNIRLSRSSVQFLDEARNNDVRLTDIALDLPFVSAMPADVAIDVQPHFSARIEGSPLTIQARVRPFDASRSASLDLELQQLQLDQLNPYLPAGSGLSVSAGQASVHMGLVFAENGKGRQLSVKGRLDVSGLDLGAPSFAGKVFPLLHVGSLGLELTELRPFERQVELAAVKASDVRLALHRNASGAIEGLHRVKSSGAGGTASPAWRVDLQQLALDALALDYQDASLSAEGKPPLRILVKDMAVKGESLGMAPQGASQPVGRLSVSAKAVEIDEPSGVRSTRINLSAVEVSTDALQTDLQAAMPVRLALRVGEKGNVVAQGSLQPQSEAVDFKLQLNRLPLPLLQAYLETRLKVALDQGSLDGDLAIAHSKAGFRLGGDVAVKSLRTRDLIDRRRLLDAGNLQVKALDLRVGPGKPVQLAIGGVTVSDLDARLVLKSDGHLNLTDLLVASAAQQTAQPKAAAATPPASPAEPVIDVGRIALSNVNVSFTDQLVKPAFSARLTGLSGGLSAFSSAGSRLSTVDLTGSLDGDGLLVVSGQFNPVKPREYLRLNLRARGIEMTRLSPYAAKYAGYNIAKGKLSTTLSYAVDKGQLTAQNQLFLDQLTFGDAVNSPDATTLPVRLGVALLKNLKGEIDLELPVSGSLSDPQFSLGKVVFKALGNIILKAVAAPFSVLSSVFAGPEESFGGLDFEPGSSAVPTSAERQIRALTQLLTEKRVELDVTGFADPLNDTLGLKRERIRQRVLRAWLAADANRTGQWADIPEKQRSATIEKIYGETDFKGKPKNLIGLDRKLPVDDMMARLEAEVTITPEDLKRLAYDRAVAARSAIVQGRPELSDRVFLLAPSAQRLGAQAEKPRAWVEFILR
jgi:hypothetical protein